MEIKWEVIWLSYGHQWMRTVLFDSEREAEQHADRYLRPQKPMPLPFKAENRSDKTCVTVRSVVMPPRS